MGLPGGEGGNEQTNRNEKKNGGSKGERTRRDQGGFQNLFALFCSALLGFALLCFACGRGGYNVYQSVTFFFFFSVFPFFLFFLFFSIFENISIAIHTSAIALPLVFPRLFTCIHTYITDKSSVRQNFLFFFSYFFSYFFSCSSLFLKKLVDECWWGGREGSSTFFFLFFSKIPRKKMVCVCERTYICMFIQYIRMAGDPSPFLIQLAFCGVNLCTVRIQQSTHSIRIRVCFFFFLAMIGSSLFPFPLRRAPLSPLTKN